MMSKVLNISVVLLALLCVGGQAMAYAPESELMKIKGYSPETIETADKQRSRMEWRQASSPTLTPREKFFHNIYYGNWIGDFDDFGNTVIRD